MGIPVREMLRRMSSTEFLQYQILYTIDPWGSARGDLQAGVVASTIANTVPRKKGSAGRRWKPADFVLEFFRRRRRRQSVADMAAMMRSFAEKHGTVK